MPLKSMVVVEDDPTLLHDATLILEKSGLSVHAFNNAENALDYIFVENRNVSALFSDMQMPGHLDGLTLAEIVGRNWPEIKVLLISGRVQPMQTLPHNVHFISKPWTLSQVMRILNL